MLLGCVCGAGIGTGGSVVRRGTGKALPNGPARMAGIMTSSATTPAMRIVIINQPSRCVGVKVLKANTASDRPLISAACSVGGAAAADRRPRSPRSGRPTSSNLRDTR